MAPIPRTLVDYVKRIDRELGKRVSKRLVGKEIEQLRGYRLGPDELHEYATAIIVEDRLDALGLENDNLIVFARSELGCILE